LPPEVVPALNTVFVHARSDELIALGTTG
jgi:hypothetical protein